MKKFILPLVLLSGYAVANDKDCSTISDRELRLNCYDKQAENSNEHTALTARQRDESRTLDNPFSLTAYRPNYILPITYNSHINPDPFTSIYPDANMDHTEAKFQISFKAKIWEVNDKLNLWGGYTQENWWQLYNSQESAPFRETNYQPELFATYDTNTDIFGSRMKNVSLSFNHQSNGRGELLSRSWNRIIAGALFDSGSYVINPRIWYRLPEDKQDDDNPQMDKYYGYGDVRVATTRNNMTFSALLRNNLRTEDNKGAVQLDWSFPLNNRFKGYVQYFYGYGESLIDYNVITNRIGVGVMLTDWL